MEDLLPQRSRVCRAIDALNTGLGRATNVLVLAMVLVSAGNALLRYAGRFTGTSLSSNAWLELQWYLFALVFLFGASAALRDDAHVRVDVFLHRLSPRRRAWIDLIGLVVFLIPFCLLMIWAAWNPVRNAWAIWEQSPDPGGLPRWPIKTAVPIAFLLLGLQGVANAARAWARLRRPPSEAGTPS